MGAFRSVVCWVCLPPGVAFCSVGAIATAAAGGSTASVHRWYTTFARICAAFAGTRVAVYGREHIDPGGAYVVVSNHESNWDPVAIISGLPELHIRFVAKAQLSSVPLFGKALELTGNIMVDRRRSGADVKRLRAEMHSRDASVSMLFFAEGSRSRDGGYREFKKGAFATALAFGLPILPIATAGTRKIWKPGSWKLNAGPAIVEVGAPIPVEDLDHDARGNLRDATHEAVRQLRARARQRVRALGVDPGGID